MTPAHSEHLAVLEKFSSKFHAVLTLIGCANCHFRFLFYVRVELLHDRSFPLVPLRPVLSPASLLLRFPAASSSTAKTVERRLEAAADIPTVLIKRIFL